MHDWRAGCVGVVLAGVLGAAPSVQGEEPTYGTLVVAGGHEDGLVPEERAKSEVRQSDLGKRLPRSAPDALKYEPGVFVQQTAHGQGSAFIRGLTGQQTLILFDGIRLNNGTYRQGPNQYFFTLDSRTIDSIEILRGGASTRFGSDALGGVILAHPVEPLRGDEHSWKLVPRLFLRGTTADDERGGRLQLGASLGDKLGMIGGFGARRVGLLKGGGAVRSPVNGQIPWVPRLAEDGRTQLGTGYDEVTGDGRVVYRLSQGHEVTVAAYAYRQYDSPRTDQCPPPEARFDQCLMFEEQFRTLVYGVYSGELGRWARSLRGTLSWQRQHERRNLDRPASFVKNLGRDDVDTLGTALIAVTETWKVRPWLGLALTYGGDTYHDQVVSRSWITFTDVDLTRELSRGQYLDGSSYTYGGTFLDGEARIAGDWLANAGGRASWVYARAPEDSESGSLPVDRAWFPFSGHLGLRWRVASQASILAGIDRSFRAPNLDDMTSRQQTGPGFQFENPSLSPERATTMELGFRWKRRPISADAWVFRTFLDDAVIKVPKQAFDCPPETPGCLSSRTQVRLENAKGRSEIRGFEGGMSARVPVRAAQVSLRGTVAWTWGEDPDGVPLSRIPPTNGTMEADVTHRVGLGVGTSLRWALAQRRLALSDTSDARIPLGGTPGYAVVDVRASCRLGARFAVAAVLENLFDQAYRTHGSSVNGPGRGLMLSFELSPGS
ncbi:MAG: TonB-dependent receptor [Deltaproteobacteria bacterium]|nr:TonB-dependent receptor [Deltaproteobacteria bacterium]